MAMLILSVVLVLFAQCRSETVDETTDISNPEHHYKNSYHMRFQADEKTWQAAKDFCPTVDEGFVLMDQYWPWTGKVMWAEEVPAGVNEVWAHSNCGYYRRGDQSTYTEDNCSSATRPFVCVKTTRVEVPVKDYS